MTKRGVRGGVYDPLLSLRTPAPALAALRAFAAAESLAPSKAASVILQDWLRTHGWLEADDVKPVGPATDAVGAMDEAIAKDRRGRSKKGNRDG